MVILALLAALAFSSPPDVCDGISARTGDSKYGRGRVVRRLCKPPCTGGSDAREDGQRRSRALSSGFDCGLEQREALLRDFIVRAPPKQPQFSDPRSYQVGDGRHGRTSRRDPRFRGEPHHPSAGATNIAHGDVSFLLSATLESARGAHSGASTVVFLHAGETRTVELFCPDDIAPRTLTWSTMPL